MVLLAESHMTMVVGMVLDVADYIPFLSTNVNVKGLKRGVSDTGGLIIPLMHIPLADAHPLQ